MIVAERCNADTVDAAEPDPTVSVSTYLTTPGVASRPNADSSMRFAAVAVTAPVEATVVPEASVSRIFSVADTPFVPTVNAAHPCKRIPDTTAMSLKFERVSVPMIVSVPADGDAPTVLVLWNRADKSSKMTLDLIGSGMAQKLRGIALLVK